MTCFYWAASGTRWTWIVHPRYRTCVHSQVRVLVSALESILILNEYVCTSQVLVKFMYAITCRKTNCWLPFSIHQSTFFGISWALSLGKLFIWSESHRDASWHAQRGSQKNKCVLWSFTTKFYLWQIKIVRIRPTNCFSIKVRKYVLWGWFYDQNKLTHKHGFYFGNKMWLFVPNKIWY